MRSDKFGSQIDKKSKTWFFTLPNMYVSWMEQEKFWSHSFHLQHSGSLQTKIDQRGDPTKMNFDNFQL